MGSAKALADVVAACIAGPVCPWKTVKYFSISSRQMMICHYSSSTTCRAIIVMAALERFAAFRRYCNPDRERLSSYLLFCICSQELVLTGYTREIWGLFKSVEICTMCTPLCQCLAGVWRHSLICDQLNFTSERFLAQKRKRCDFARRSCKSLIGKVFTRFSWKIGRRHWRQLTAI